MTTIDMMAAVITVMLYISVYADTWQDRCRARLCLGSVVAVILALTV